MIKYYVENKTSGSALFMKVDDVVFVYKLKTNSFNLVKSQSKLNDFGYKVRNHVAREMHIMEFEQTVLHLLSTGDQ